MQAEIYRKIELRVATVAECHASTGFEALLGELFLTNKTARLDEICEMALIEGGIFDRNF